MGSEAGDRKWPRRTRETAWDEPILQDRRFPPFTQYRIWQLGQKKVRRRLLPG